MTFTPTPAALKDSTEVSKRTIQRRSKFLKEQINFVSGSAKATSLQTGAIIKSMTTDKREEILKMGNIKSVEIDAEKMVAMKAHLGLPWEKMKVMAR